MIGIFPCIRERSRCEDRNRIKKTNNRNSIRNGLVYEYPPLKKAGTTNAGPAFPDSEKRRFYASMNGGRYSTL